MPTLVDAMKPSASAATVGQKKKTPAMMHDQDSSQSRRESRATDAGPPAPRRRDTTHDSSSPTRSQNRKESHLHDGMQAHQQRFGRPSRTSYQPRPSIGGSHRSVVYSNEDGHRPQHAVENTYRLDPTEGERFNVAKVQKLLDEFLINYIGGEQYDAQKCSKMAVQMSDIVKERVKKMDFLRRHKIHCHVVIGQNLGQGVQVASRSLWDTSNDCSVTATYHNNSLFAVATVFAVYYC